MAERRSFKHHLYALAARVVWSALDLPLAGYALVVRRPASRATRYCVLLHSFDGYKRFWPAALFFTTRSLPQTIPLICATERVAMDAHSAQCLLTGSGSFVRRLAKAVHELRRSYRYILYLQEDMWLQEPISSGQLDGWIRLMERYRLHCLKLAAEGVPSDVRSQLAAEPPLDSAAGQGFTWYGRHGFALSHHGSLFDSDFLLKSLVFAYLMGARQPKAHEIFVSKGIRDLVSTPANPAGSVRIAAWQKHPAITYVHASDGGDLTPEARAALQADPLCPPLDEALANEVFPARSSLSRGFHSSSS